MLPIGVCINDIFQPVDDTNHVTIKPFKNNAPVTIDIYQGLYSECKCNIKIASVILPFYVLWKLLFVIKNESCYICCEDISFLSESFKLVNTYQTDAHNISYISGKTTDDLWRLHYVAKDEYCNYIQQHKSTLYDEQIKFSIGQLTPHYPIYNKLIDKFERAEQLCYVNDMTIQEYHLALDEIDSYIKPIMQQIVINHSTNP